MIELFIIAFFVVLISIGLWIVEKEYPYTIKGDEDRFTIHVTKNGAIHVDKDELCEYRNSDKFKKNRKMAKEIVRQPRERLKND